MGFLLHELTAPVGLPKIIHFFLPFQHSKKFTVSLHPHPHKIVWKYQTSSKSNNFMCGQYIYMRRKKRRRKKSPLGQTHPDIKFRIYYLRFLDLKGNHFSFVSMLAYISVSGLKPLQQYVLFDFIKSIFTYQNIFIVCN